MYRTRSHKEDLDSFGNYLLTRSCLEVDVDVNGVVLVMYLNHFRSMRGSEDGRWESGMLFCHYNYSSLRLYLHSYLCVCALCSCFPPYFCDLTIDAST